MTDDGACISVEAAEAGGQMIVVAAMLLGVIVARVSHGDDVQKPRLQWEYAQLSFVTWTTGNLAAQPDYVFRTSKQDINATSALELWKKLGGAGEPSATWTFSFLDLVGDQGWELTLHETQAANGRYWNDFYFKRVKR